MSPRDLLRVFGPVIATSGSGSRRLSALRSPGPWQAHLATRPAVVIADVNKPPGHGDDGL
jgi:hypothetical protein